MISNQTFNLPLQLRKDFSIRSCFTIKYYFWCQPNTFIKKGSVFEERQLIWIHVTQSPLWFFPLQKYFSAHEDTKTQVKQAQTRASQELWWQVTSGEDWHIKEHNLQ